MQASQEPVELEVDENHRSESDECMKAFLHSVRNIVKYSLDTHRKRLKEVIAQLLPPRMRKPSRGSSSATSTTLGNATPACEVVRDEILHMD
jgi:hypothetical protein